MQSYRQIDVLTGVHDTAVRDGAASARALDLFDALMAARRAPYGTTQF